MRHEGTEQLIGTSAVIAELSQEIDRIARSDAKVLITGESGVGKELVAHAIHQRSPRVARPIPNVRAAATSGKSAPEVVGDSECESPSTLPLRSKIATSAPTIKAMRPTSLP